MILSHTRKLQLAKQLQELEISVQRTESSLNLLKEARNKVVEIKSKSGFFTSLKLKWNLKSINKKILHEETELKITKKNLKNLKDSLNNLLKDVNHMNTTKNETPEEKAKRIGVPLIGKKEETNPEPNPTVAVCGECGREVKKVEFYSCRKSNCPVQIKVSFNKPTY